ncbi:SUZ domain-containing protein 1 [Mactra antiquata]
MAEDGDVLESWEELDDNEVLDKRLQDIKITERENNSSDGVVSQIKEEGNRTQYTPQVRILKRSSENTSEKTNITRTNVQPQKTLQQREAEYKEARLRILGENYSGSDNCNNSAAISEETKPVQIIKQKPEQKSMVTNKVQLLREPKGPDGSIGFDQPR